jgi:class 3 adenylate cyclase
LESLGQPGTILVAEATYERLKHKHRFENGRSVNIKGRGKENVYTLLRRL